MKIVSKSVKETLNLGKRLSGLLQAGDIICLEGNLGSGKTVLTKGIAEGLGIEKEKVTSSSFILIRQHFEGRFPLYHFDLYRLKDPLEIATLGYEEYLYGGGISVIEWAEKLGCLIPKEYLMIKLTYFPGNKRSFDVSARGKRYKVIMEKLNAHIGN